MKIPKFINKKMIIFVILIIAFIYFLGSLNIIREGLDIPKPKPKPKLRSAAAATTAAAQVPSAPASSKYLTPGTLTGFDMDCCECLRSGDCSKQTNCQRIIKERNITNEQRKCIYDKSTKNSYFQPRQGKIMRGIDCTGCKKSPSDPKCNVKCPTDINYAEYNCLYDNVHTVCTNISNVADIKQ
jgi:hypothetical protein